MNTTADIKLEKANPDDLKERMIDLDKSVAGQDFNRVVKILKYFQKIEMTMAVLVATKIGKTLTPLSTLKCPFDRKDLEDEASKIREISAGLLVEWKKLLNKPVEATPAQKPILPPTPKEELTSPLAT